MRKRRRRRGFDADPLESGEVYGVFISSTFGDLGQHRQVPSVALRKAGHDVIEMEGFAARDEQPFDDCLSKVCRSKRVRVPCGVAFRNHARW